MTKAPSITSSTARIQHSLESIKSSLERLDSSGHWIVRDLVHRQQTGYTGTIHYRVTFNRGGISRLAAEEVRKLDVAVAA